MGSPRLPLVFLALFAAPGWAAPGVPGPDSPRDGGWCARACELAYTFRPFTSQTVGAQLEVRDDQGTLVATRTEPIASPASDSWTTPDLPDAGFFSWQVRGLDDAGVVSSWSAASTFVVDGIPPPAPASVTTELDGGFLRITSAPVVDLESGLVSYHFGVSRLDQADGSVAFGGSFNITGTSLTRELFFGPGTWFVGAHGHDAVDNPGITTAVGPLVIPISGVLPQPPVPEPVRTDGGAWANFPYVSTNQLRFRLDAGSATVTSWAFSSRPAASGEWEYTGFGPGPAVQIASLPLGLQDVRVALVSGLEVSAWSDPVRIHVDENSPLALTLTAQVDGGLVELRWPLGRDTSAGASGVREYAVSRSAPDASVVLPRVPHPTVGPVVFTDVPGFGRWAWSVRSVDRAGNSGPTATVTTELTPPAPTGLSANPMVTRLPIELSWADERDAGFVQVWSVRRLDALDASVSVADAVTLSGLIDDAPEGTWSYEVSALVNGATSAPARLDGVVRDVTVPSVAPPQLTRLGARTVELTWVADDALSGLASVTLEREGNEVVSLGPQQMGFTDTPQVDGTYRYRVVAADRAGNTATSDWSAAFVSPGAGVVVEPLAPRALVCGERLDQTFVANEPVSWSVLGAPEGATLTDGVFSWTPSAGDVGALALTVRAEGATSADQRDWQLEVSCERRRPSVGCGCQSLDVSLLAVVLVFVRRRVTTRDEC